MVKNPKSVWVFSEQHAGKLVRSSLELISAARPLADKLNTKLEVLLLGHNIEDAAREITQYNIDALYIIDHPALKNYLNRNYIKAVCDSIKQHMPDIFLIAATSIGKDFAPAVAANLQTGLTAECIKLDIGPQGNLQQIVPAFGGRLMATVVCRNTRPQMATVQPGLYPKPLKRQNTNPHIEHIRFVPSGDKPKIKLISLHKRRPASTPLKNAKTVIVGGWGIETEKNWKLLEDLAPHLNGALGATRPVIDKGWASMDLMIGQSGHTLQPQLYIGFGVSGALQHLIGIQDPKLVVAINKDPKAPIFKYADIGLIADVNEILPELIKQLEEKLENR